jgi:hypothetical protein
MVALQNGFKPFTITLDTVYGSLTGRVANVQQSIGTSPTFEVSGLDSSVNVYISNSVTKPGNKNSMTLDDGSPFSTGAYRFMGQVKWVLFEQDQGSSVINTINLVEVGQ